MIFIFIWTLMIVILYMYLLLQTRVEMNRQIFKIFHNSKTKIFLLKSLFGFFVLNYSFAIYPLSYITGKVMIYSITEFISSG